jgi:hypothetical protein
VIRRIDRAAWEREKGDLQSMAEALTASILRTKTITNYANIPLAIKDEMALPLSTITNTPRGWRRAFLVDPNMSFDGSGSKTLTQGPGGTARPVKARVMFISALTAGTLPASSDNNTDFQTIWDTPEGVRPSVWSSSSPKGEDIVIKKCDLDPLFYQLILVNRDTTNTAYYSIDSTNLMPLFANSAGLGDSYYLDGTAVGLHDCSGALETKYLLKRNISFVFDACNWSGGLRAQPAEVDPLATVFFTAANNFYHATNNPALNNGGASVFSVLVLMHSFMFDFTLWANECPHFDAHGTASSPEYTLLYNIGGNSQALDAVSGSGGLLK